MFRTTALSLALLLGLSCTLVGQDNKKAENAAQALRAKYQQAALAGGNSARGKQVFTSEKAGCVKCHLIEGDGQRAGPDLRVVGDKYALDQLIRSVLEPSAAIHPDYATLVVTTVAGKVHTGVLRKRTNQEIQLLDAESKLVRIPLDDVDEEKRSPTSLMPAKLAETMSAEQFADLTAFLTTLKQPVTDPGKLPGLVNEIPMIKNPIRLERLHTKDIKFDHPVCVIASPGSKTDLMVVEQKTRKIWRLQNKTDRELFADLSGEATTGQFEGVMCLAFHPRFLENRKYYVNYHVRNQGSFFSPIIAERQATADLHRDAGGASRRLLQIPQDTDLHWGGMLAFGPDGYLYIGAGDAGPQEDPEGHSQDLSLLLGSILRIDVDRQEGGKAYAIPATNPYRDAGPKIRPEIWASGFRMPWRFSFDGPTGDLWVGDIGQNLFEEVSIARVGEDHGWNVYEGFTKFSERYRRQGAKYTSPIVSYRRKLGVSVTGGYVYRGNRSPSYQGVYIFGDFESKSIWALTQRDRKLQKIRRIGESPEKISSFGIDANGELLLVGYEGTLFRVVLDDSVFE